MTPLPLRHHRPPSDNALAETAPKLAVVAKKLKCTPGQCKARWEEMLDDKPETPTPLGRSPAESTHMARTRTSSRRQSRYTPSSWGHVSLTAITPVRLDINHHFACIISAASQLRLHARLTSSSRLSKPASLPPCTEASKHASASGITSAAPLQQSQPSNDNNRQSQTLFSFRYSVLPTK